MASTYQTARDRHRRTAAVVATAGARRQRPGGALYSHFVGFLKLLLPMIATALMLVVVIWPQLSSRIDRIRIGVADISIEDAKNLIMVNPRYQGIDDEARPYALTAGDAKQASGDDQMVQLSEPKADITLADGTWVALTAEFGNLYRDIKLLDLFGAVNLYHDQGYEFHTASAQFDVASGGAAGNEPVFGQSPLGTVEAQGFRILNNGQSIHFIGRTHMVIYPGARRPGS